MRWLRSRERTTTADHTTLAAIRIFTRDIELRGAVAPAGQRITDLLLRGQDLAFLPAGAEPTPEHWLAVATSDILFVVPPPLPPRSAGGPAPNMRKVSVIVGPYRLTGTAHVKGDEELDATFVARQPFLPLTSAEILRAGAPSEALDVVIVNLAASTRVGPA
jgi:hypothetical protein